MTIDPENPLLGSDKGPPESTDSIRDRLAGLGMSAEEAEKWLGTHIKALGGNRPIDLMADEQTRAQVEQIISELESPGAV